MATSYWRPVPRYPDIEVSESLEFRTIERTRTFPVVGGTTRTRTFPSHILKIMWFDKGGYGNVFITSLRRAIGAHVLVCLAWHGEPPVGKTYALHRDGDPANFHPSNLYWGSAKDNSEDARRHGTLATGLRHGSKTHPHKFGKRPNGPNPPFKYNTGNTGCPQYTLRKLTTCQVSDIRQNYVPRHQCFGAKAMALAYSVDPATIRKVLYGITYKGI